MTSAILDAQLLGTDVRFESNRREVVEHARAFVRSYRGAESSEAVNALRVGVHVRTDATAPETPIKYVDGGAGRLFLHSSAAVGAVEPLRRESVAWVTEKLMNDGALFREKVLEALTLALIACFDRHPVHASAVEHNGNAILLAGASGAGKSTLAWLAHEAGYNVLTDDRTWVQLQPSLRVWGGPASVRLAQSGPAKRSVSLNTGTRSTPVSADSARVCILARGNRATLERIAPQAVHKHLNAQLAPGFDRFPERHETVLNAIARDGGWLMTLTSTPTDALPLLHSLLETAE